MSRNKLMVINAGSSSLKFKLFQMGGAGGQALKAVASGICERVGDSGASFIRVGAPTCLLGCLVCISAGLSSCLAS